MTDEGQPSLAELDAAIAATRREYASQRDSLEARLAGHFVDGGDVADRLLSVADEFGREHALELLAERPDDYGVREQRGDYRDAAAELAPDLERLIETHDRLDELARQRDMLEPLADGRPIRTIHIQGRAYEFDGERRELRDRDSGERVSAELEAPAQSRPLSLTEQARLDAGVPRAQPRPGRDRTRER